MAYFSESSLAQSTDTGVTVLTNSDAVKRNLHARLADRVQPTTFLLWCLYWAVKNGLLLSTVYFTSYLNHEDSKMACRWGIIQFSASLQPLVFPTLHAQFSTLCLGAWPRSDAQLGSLDPSLPNCDAILSILGQLVRIIMSLYLHKEAPHIVLHLSQ